MPLGLTTLARRAATLLALAALASPSPSPPSSASRSAPRRVVLVTGGGRGIGAAISKRMATKGDRVVINFKGDRESAETVLESLPGDGHCVVQCDVSDPTQVMDMVNQCVERYGRLDVVVNNAGLYEETPVLSTSYEEYQRVWKETVATNLIGPANICYCAANIMAKQEGGGAIVSVSSRGAYRGEPDALAYGATKAGLNALSQSLAKSLGGVNVAVSVVAPGFISTDMAAPVLAGPRGDAIRADSPFGRVGTPEEVAAVVDFLSQPDARWVSGTAVDCNGASYIH